MKKIHVLVQYSGDQFFGWAKQANKFKTVENIMEINLKRILKEPNLKINCASRTDSGVHAVRNSFDFLIKKSNIISLKSIENIINSSKEYMYIQNIKEVSMNFDSKKKIESREYVYRIFLLNRNVLKKEFQKFEPYLWFYKDNLDFEKMKRVSKLFIGKHDFKKFSSKSNQNPNVDTKREIFDISIERKIFKISEFDFPKLSFNENEFKGGGEIIEIKVKGKSFLYHQIRWIVGYLIQIGNGNIENEKYLNWNKKRLLAPPNGLYLYKINYEK